jgi:hypothetical protein
VDGTHVQPSVRGFDFLNDLQALFLPAVGQREKTSSLRTK